MPAPDSTVHEVSDGRWRPLSLAGKSLLAVYRYCTLSPSGSARPVPYQVLYRTIGLPTEIVVSGWMVESDLQDGLASHDGVNVPD